MPRSRRSRRPDLLDEIRRLRDEVAGLRRELAMRPAVVVQPMMPVPVYPPTPVYPPIVVEPYWISHPGDIICGGTTCAGSYAANAVGGSLADHTS